MGTRTPGFPLTISTDGLNPTATPATFFDGTNAIGANRFGVPFHVERCGSLAFQVSCPATGTPNGSFAIQGSNDVSLQESNGKPDTNLLNWSTLSFVDEATGATVQSKAVAGAQSFIASIQNITPRWVRFVWTNTSGSALLSVRAQEKGVT